MTTPKVKPYKYKKRLDKYKSLGFPEEAKHDPSSRIRIAYYEHHQWPISSLNDSLDMVRNTAIHKVRWWFLYAPIQGNEGIYERKEKGRINWRLEEPS